MTKFRRKRINVLKGYRMPVSVQKNTMTIQARLTFENETDKQKVLDIASAYVIARRGLGLKEKVPANYIKLIERLGRDCLEELKEYVRKTSRNGYLRNEQVKEIYRAIQSLESKPERVSDPLDGTSFDTRNLWQVIRVAVMTSLSSDRILRDLSVLKPLPVSGQVEKTSKGREFLFSAQGLWLSQIPPAGDRESLKRRDTNTPAKLCGFAQFD